MDKTKRIGKIEAVVGPMFSGKTSTILNAYERAIRQKKKVIVFKPKYDNRYSEDSVVNHKKDYVPATSVASVDDIISTIHTLQPNFVIFDEIQFFCQPFVYGDILQCIRLLTTYGIDILVAGLSTDYKDNPFPVTANLLAISDSVKLLTAVCEKCGENAIKTSKKVDNGDNFELGAEDKYYAECRHCKFERKKFE